MLSQYQELIQIGNIYGYRQKERSWKDLSNQEKKEACTRQTGRHMVAKYPNGQVERTPIYCNLCEGCYKANALKLRSRVGGFVEKLERESQDGEWRKKTVENGTEAQSLKRHISRNQEGRYFEVAASQSTNDIYIYVENEPGKDLDKIYGQTVSLEDIDYDAMYKANRSTGKKMSTGKFFRSGSVKGKEGTIRVSIPQLVVDDERKAEEVLRETNYLHLAETPEEAKELYNYQTKCVIEELTEAGIKILAVELKFYNFDGGQLMQDWNQNVKYWMSINASCLEKSEANSDNLTSRLYQKEVGEPEQLLN